MRQPGPCVRALCEAVAVLLSTCAIGEPFFRLHTALFTLHHFALHTPHFMHFTFTLHSSCSTLHTSSQLISSQLFLPLWWPRLHTTNFYTPQVFTQISFYTQQTFTQSKLLHREAFNYTQKAFTYSKLYTEKAFTHSKLLHIASFYAERLSPT